MCVNYSEVGCGLRKSFTTSPGQVRGAMSAASILKKQIIRGGSPSELLTVPLSSSTLFRGRMCIPVQALCAGFSSTLR